MMKQVASISVVSPVYMGAATLDELVTRLIAELSRIAERFEIILVDDCSPDNSWERIEAWQLRDARVKGMRLSRNFGQHLAIAAGVDHAQCEWLVVMDCDLQDSPEEISRLCTKALEGFDTVMGSRTDRQDSFLKGATSRLFFYFLSYLAGRKVDASVGNFGVFHRKVIDAVKSMHESSRWFPGMVHWVGFKSTTIDVAHGARKAGKSTYSIRRLLHLGIDIICMFSDKPLRLSVKGGFCLSLFSFFLGVFIAIRALVGSTAPPLGWASLIVSIWFLSGLIIFNLGVMGLYVGRIFNEVKNRPPYIVNTRVGF